MVWKFASPPPETGSLQTANEVEYLLELPEPCPELQRGDTNGVLYENYVTCRERLGNAIDRVILYDKWVEIERVAHGKFKEETDGNRQDND